MSPVLLCVKRPRRVRRQRLVIDLVDMSANAMDFGNDEENIVSRK
jgi:hypothetical protein